MNLHIIKQIYLQNSNMLIFTVNFSLKAASLSHEIKYRMIYECGTVPMKLHTGIGEANCLAQME